MNYHHYSPVPKGYTPYYDSSSPHTSAEYVYYAPQDDPTSSRKHSRKISHTATPTKPKQWGYHSPAGYPEPQFYEISPDYKSPPRKDLYYVSEKGIQASKPRSYSINGKRPAPTTTHRKPTQPVRIYDSAEEAEYIYAEPRNYVEPKQKTKPRPMKADSYFYFSQDQIYDEQAKRSRARKSSTATKSPQKPPKSTNTKPPPKATEEDAIEWGIPAGYSIKNWDPTELPIILLGSVFDANSLGKWIYDWTVYHHGASTPMADVAGDLWLLLIKLAGKMKRAQECVHRIRGTDNRDMVEDFIDSGKRLWQKFKDLLKECEKYMWKAAKREGSKGVSMGKNAGTEFVDSIFGRDRQLENSEKLMNSIRLWNMRFDANCEEILRRPSVA
jgi:hypothetical protein